MRQQPGPITIVAVDGHSAAGKSTFAAALAGEVGASLVRGDDFYRVLDEGERARLGPAQGADLYYDWQRLRDEVLRPLRDGRPAQFHPYDWANNALQSRRSTIRPAPTVVVEGLFVSRPELAEWMDMTICVTTDPAERRRRQAARADASPDWVRRWDGAEQWYFANVRPPDTFDLTVEASSGPDTPRGAGR